MLMRDNTGYFTVFLQDDPRIERKKRHPMPEIRLLTLCEVICGAAVLGYL